MRLEQSEFMVCDLAGQQKLRWNVNFPDSHAGRVGVLVFEFSFQVFFFLFPFSASSARSKAPNGIERSS